MGDGTSVPSVDTRAELDRQLFHLKTLYDVSRQLLGAAEVEPTLKNFLMTVTGNFGVIEGFILTQDSHSKEISHMVSVGINDSDRESLTRGAGQVLVKGPPG